jgi:branched-chain amino acid aminotransferase
MNDGNYILVNGAFVTATEYQISLQELDGFLFAEKVRAVRSAFPFFRDSLEMIVLKLHIFSRTFPELTANEGEELKRQMERTLTKNKHFFGSIITIRFWFCERKLQYSVQSTKTETTGYELNNKGLYIAVFQNIRKSISTLSNLSLGSEVYWKIADYQLKNESVDQLLLLNTQDEITESIGSNIYVIKRGIVKGARKNQGAYTDITKPLMLSIFDELKLSYTENDGITEQELRDAEEIFLVNAIDGIRWVLGFEGKRYFNNTIKKINELFISNLIN